ncbi:hypothetical protein ACHAWF_010916 [Thalassiosira exigua]
MKIAILFVVVHAAYAQKSEKLFAKNAKSKAGGKLPSTKASKDSGGGGCKCVGDTEYIFNSDEMTWISHYKEAKSRGCELASIADSHEQFQALSSAALGWQLQTEETTNDIHAVWIGGKRIKAEGGGRTVGGNVDESPWRWSDGTAWIYSNWNYNEPTNGRYCEEEDTYCYENRVCMQVVDQVFPLSDINGNPNIVLTAGDWHDNPGNLIFPGLYKCCFAYQCNAVVGNGTVSS